MNTATPRGARVRLLPVALALAVAAAATAAVLAAGQSYFERVAAAQRVVAAPAA